MKSIRRSISMTPEMRDRLQQLASKHPRTIKEADLIREAIRLYLDEQQDIIGSRRHFQKSLQQRLDQLENLLTFHLNVLIFLIATDDPEIHQILLDQAIKAARKNSKALKKRMQP
jgi:hypothetical protein